MNTRRRKMKCRICRIYLLGACLFLTTSVLANDLHREREKGARQSFLLAKGKSFSVHLFQGGVLDHTGGYVISHTAHDSGKMTWLYCSGLYPPRTRRITYVYKKICGLLCDEKRLYLAECASHRFVTDRTDHRPATKRDLEKYLNNREVRFGLLVFTLQNGKLLGRYPLPATAPGTSRWIRKSKNYTGIILRDHLGHGPLELKDGELHCFGHRFIFKDDKLLEVQPPKEHTGPVRGPERK